MRRDELEMMTKSKLLLLARELDLSGRSTLSKDGLVDALMKAQARSRKSPFSSKKSSSKKAGRKKQTTKTSAKADASTRAGLKKTTKKAAGKVAAKATKKVTKTAAKKATKKVAKKATKKTTKKVTKDVAKKVTKKVTKKVAGKKTSSAKAIKTTSKPAPPKAVKKTTKPTVVSPANGLPSRGIGAELKMPNRYDKNYLVMMSRDPHWLYVYWEITPDSIEKTQAKLGKDWDNNRLVLRVFTYPIDDSGDDTKQSRGSSFDIDLPGGVESWYINAGRPDHRYQVAVGIISRSGRFVAFAKSGLVPMLRDGVSPIKDEKWSTIPDTFKRLYEVAMPAGSGLMADAHSSGELGLLLRERLRSDWSSGQLASMGSDSLGGEQGRERGFWFHLDAELIVYGATEPDATVTIQGRPIALRPDGTFNLRFQLPDGTQVIDATAVSADKVFRKTITPTVRRATRSTEMIESEAKS